MSLALQSVPSQARSLIDDKDVESHAVQVQLAKKERAATFSPALIFSLVLTSLLGIAGFIMAAWSTHQLKTANEMTTSLTSAILVTNPAETPTDYSLVVNMFRGTGYWSARKTLPFQRSDHGVAAYNGLVYIMGGYSSEINATGSSVKTILSKFVQFDPVYSVYTNLTDMPEPRARFGWSVAGDKLYVFGGMTTTNDTAPPVDTTLVYDFKQKTWTTSPARISEPKSDMCAGTYNNKIYMIGGYNRDASVAFTDIEQYDPATNQWTVLPGPKLNLGRGDCSVVVSGNQLYVLGGTYFKDNGNCNSPQWYLCYLFTNTVERVDIVANTSVPVAPMRNARGDFGAAESTPGRILVAGGEYNDSSLGVSRLMAQPWVEEYDISANYWTPKAPMPTSGFRFSMVNAAKEVIAFGGHPSCPSPDQSGDECYAEGMDNVLAFTDIQETYPNVYLLVRNKTAS